jgi:hypothetical protein
MTKEDAMLAGTLKRLILLLAFAGSFAASLDRLAAAPGRSRLVPVGAASAPVDHQPRRRHRPPVDEGCRVLPESTPAAPPPPATCS